MKNDTFWGKCMFLLTIVNICSYLWIIFIYSVYMVLYLHTVLRTYVYHWCLKSNPSLDWESQISYSVWHSRESRDVFRFIVISPDVYLLCSVSWLCVSKRHLRNSIWTRVSRPLRQCCVRDPQFIIGYCVVNHQGCSRPVGDANSTSPRQSQWS